MQQISTEFIINNKTSLQDMSQLQDLANELAQRIGISQDQASNILK